MIAYPIRYPKPYSSRGRIPRPDPSRPVPFFKPNCVSHASLVSTSRFADACRYANPRCGR